jgi:hypothetical protein
MPVQQTIPYNDGTFFITFTCHKWLPLIEMVNGYDLLYSIPGRVSTPSLEARQDTAGQTKRNFPILV